MQQSKQVASHWEKLTGGQCNNDEAIPKARKATVRSLKRQLWRENQAVREATGQGLEARAEAKFKKAQALAALGTPEARKELRKLGDRWDKRTTKNVQGFHNPKAAKHARV